MTDKTTGSLEASDKAAADVAKTDNRVTLDRIKGLVAETEIYHPDMAPHFTFCLVKLANGFIVTGKSAPADPANFNAELGEKFALEDALRQVWQLEGYALCERLSNDS